jgi:predicted RNA-binding protein YlqC (UPF0109 family)
MKQFVEFVAKSLAEHPDQVEVKELAPNRLELRVDPSDVGSVIGRRGKTAQAMRALLRAMAPRGDRDPELEIAAHTESGSE